MTFTLTERAILQIKKIKIQQSIISPFVRAFVAGKNCSGIKYGLDFAEQSESSDIKIIQDDLSILISPKDEKLMENVVLDFYEDTDKKGFIFNNPDSSNGCGSCSTGCQS